MCVAQPFIRSGLGGWEQSHCCHSYLHARIEPAGLSSVQLTEMCSSLPKQLLNEHKKPGIAISYLLHFHNSGENSLSGKEPVWRVHSVNINAFQRWLDKSTEIVCLSGKSDHKSKLMWGEQSGAKCQVLCRGVGKSMLFFHLLICSPFWNAFRIVFSSSYPEEIIPK